MDEIIVQDSDMLIQYIAEGANWSISHLYWCATYMFFALPVPLSDITQFYFWPALYLKIALVIFKFKGREMFGRYKHYTLSCCTKTSFFV